MSDFDFEAEFKDSVSKSSKAAADATAMLARQVGMLGKAEDQAARQGLKLAKSNLAVAKAAERAAKAQARFAKEQGLGAVTRQTSARLDLARANLQMARSQRALASSSKGASLTGKGGSSGVGGMIKGAAALAVAYGVARAAGAALEKTVQFSGAVIGMGVFAEKTRLAFSLLRGGAAQGATAFAKSQELAASLGENVTTVSDRMKKLLAQQFTLAEASGLINMVADLKAIGVEGEKSDRVLTALTQIRSKGRLQAEEMLQLAEAGVSLELVYQALGKATGKTREQLMKLQKQGKIGSDMALAAVQEAVLKKVGGKKAGDAGRRFAEETIQGALGGFEGAKENFLLGVSEKSTGAMKEIAPTLAAISSLLNDGGVQGKFAKGMTALGNITQRMRPELIRAIGNGLNIAADAFDKFITLSGGFAQGFLTGIGPALESLGVNGINSIDNLLVAVTEFGGFAGRVVGDLVTKFNTLTGAVDSFLSPFKAVANFLHLENLGLGLTTGPQTIGIRVIDGIIEGLTGKEQALLGTAQRIASGVEGQFAKTLQIHSPSRVGAKLGKFFDMGVASGISANDNALQASARMGAGVNASASAGMQMPARAGSFKGSPVQSAMSNSQNRSMTFAPSVSQSFFGANGPQVAAQAKVSLFDLSAMAKAKFAVG